MCVIVFKSKGADFPSKKVIEACMKENPHGYAAAWNQDGRLMTFRTMDARAMLARYDEIRRLDPAVTAIVFHARIATHGSKSLPNCHCWTDDAGTLAFAHNGVLDNVGSRGDMTDSETFFRDIFLPVRNACGMQLAMKVSSAVAGNSKFAFIDASGRIMTIGKFSKDCEPGHKGMIYFSNMHWTRHTSQQFPFDKPFRKRAPLPYSPPLPGRTSEKGSVVSVRDDDGSFKGVYIKDLLRKGPEPASDSLF